MFNRWSFDRWNSQLFKHGSLEYFLQKPGFQAGIHEIRDGDVKIHLNLRTRQSKTLAIISHGSMNPTEVETYTMPRFSGMNIADGLDVDLLLLSDSTLALSKSNITLGWYCGSAAYDLSSRIAPIVAAIIDKRGYDKLVFVGGSGGGFASLRLVSKFPGATALVWNPQTDLGRYHPGVLKAWSEGCFDCGYDAIPVEVRRDREMNLCQSHREVPDAAIIYLQNASDTVHLEQHAIPYFTECRGVERGIFEQPDIYLIDSKALLVLGDWGDGHVPPAKTCLSDVLRLAIEAKDLDAVAQGLQQPQMMDGLYARARGLALQAEAE